MLESFSPLHGGCFLYGFFCQTSIVERQQQELEELSFLPPILFDYR